MYGAVIHSVISGDTRIEEGARCVNAVVMPGAVLQKGAVVQNAIIGPDTLIAENQIVNGENDDIALVVNRKAARL